MFVRHRYLQSHYGLERGGGSVSRGPDGDPWLWTRGLDVRLTLGNRGGPFPADPQHL